MDRVIVSLKVSGYPEELDIELPADVPTKELILMIAEALELSNEDSIIYLLSATPPGRVLGDMETLETAGVWDGSKVNLVKKNKV